MWSSAIVAALHYLALAIGLPAVFLRGTGPEGHAGRRGAPSALRGRLGVGGGGRALGG